MRLRGDQKGNHAEIKRPEGRHCTPEDPEMVFTVSNSSCGKVMFSQASVILSTGGMRGRGHAWQGTCIAGGMHGRGCVWLGACIAGGHVWQGSMHGGKHV